MYSSSFMYKIFSEMMMSLTIRYRLPKGNELYPRTKNYSLESDTPLYITR